MRKTLDELAREQGADKSGERHGFAAVYEQLLEPRRDETLTLLEIGVLEGASLRMWRDYFPAARIFGIDFLESAGQAAPPGTTVLIGNATDTPFLDAVLEATGPLDVIIDDGGHRPEQQLTSLFYLWPHLRPRGTYAIEDVHTSYLGRWSPGWRQPGTTIEVLKDIVDDVNWYWHQRDALLDDVESVQFYPELCVLAKSSPTRRRRRGSPVRNEEHQTPDPRYPGRTGAWSGRIERVEPHFEGEALRERQARARA
jgi:Methyltransferase domain